MVTYELGLWDSCNHLLPWGLITAMSPTGLVNSPPSPVAGGIGQTCIEHVRSKLPHPLPETGLVP